MTGKTFDVDSVARDDARRSILRAAAEVFQRKGFDRATIDDIADEIGATKGRVYYYFRSKFDIYLAVYEHGMTTVHRVVEPYSTGDGSGYDRLIGMCEAHLLNLVQSLGFHNAIHQGVPGQRFTALKEHQRDVLGTLDGLREEYEAMFRSVVGEGMADGTLRPGDPRLATRVMLSSLNSTSMWYRPREEQGIDDVHALVRSIVAQVVGGMVN